MNLAVFQSIGPLELLIVLGIVLMIFGPKRLPSLGRQLGAGMREFKDSVTRKSKDDDEDVIEDDPRGEPPQGRRRARASRGGDDAARLRRGRLREALAGARRLVATTLRPIRHEDRLSLVEHLDELRKRIIVCVIVFVACFGLCLWQGDVVLDIVNRPLEETAFKDKTSSKDPFERTAAFQAQLRKSALASAATYDEPRAGGRGPGHPPRLRGARDPGPGARALRPAAGGAAAGDARGRGAVHRHGADRGLRGAADRAAVPPLQAYAFVLPAFSREERGVALPLMAMVPFLFIAGVVFAYYMVLPNAIDFLQNFNDDNFDILLQAKDYYRFSITVLIAMGLCFQVPVGILAFTRLGIISVAQLRQLAPLQHPRDRGRRDAAARPGSGDDALADDPALRALRGLYPVGLVERAARAPRRRRPRTLISCSSTSEAPVGAGP